MTDCQTYISLQIKEIRRYKETIKKMTMKLQQSLAKSLKGETKKKRDDNFKFYDKPTLSMRSHKIWAKLSF
jgi:hypothetical protein